MARSRPEKSVVSKHEGEVADETWQRIHCLCESWPLGNPKRLVDLVRLNTVILVCCCCLADIWLSYITRVHCAIRAEGSEDSGHNGFIIPWDHPWANLWMMENEVDPINTGCSKERRRGTPLRPVGSSYCPFAPVKGSSWSLPSPLGIH